MTAAIVAGTAVLAWTLFVATVEGRQESALNYLPLPIFLLAALFWIRRPWDALTRGAG
jgi:hypothetical protein